MERRWVIWLLVIWLGTTESPVRGQASRAEFDAMVASLASEVIRVVPEQRQAVLDVLRAKGVPHHVIGLVMVNAAYELLVRADYEGARALNERFLTEFEPSRGYDDPRVLTAKSNLASVLLGQGDLVGARALQEEVLLVRQGVLGPGHPDTLTSMNNLAWTLKVQGDLAGARTLQESVLAVHQQALGSHHPDTLRSKNNLAETLFAQGDLWGARALHESVLSARERVLGADHPDTSRSKSNLANTLFAQGDLAGARALEESASAALERVLGADHPDTLMAKDNLAGSLRAQGDLSGARALQESVLAARQRILGAGHPDTLMSKNNLAQTLSDQGDVSGARVLQESVLTARERILGADHPDTLTAKDNLAASQLAQGDLLGAHALQEAVLSARERILGVDHPDTLTSKSNLAQTVFAQGDLSGARVLQESVLSARERVLGADHPDTLTTKNNLAGTLYAQGDLSGSRVLRESVLVARYRVLGADHPDTLTARDNLAQTLAAQGDLSGARALQESVLTARERVLGADHPATLATKNNLAETLRAQGDLSGARTLHESALAMQVRALGADHPATLTSRHNLAVTLYSLGELTAAREQWQDILATTRRVLGAEPETELEVAAFSYLADVYRDLGETELAARTSLDALDALERLTRRAADVEELRSWFRQQYDNTYYESVNLLLDLERTEVAFQVLQRYRAQSLLRRLEQRPLESDELPEELVTRRRALARQVDRTFHAVYAATSEDQRQTLRVELQRLQREQQKIEAAIRSAIPGDDPIVELADVERARAALDPGTLLVSYLVGPEETVAFTLSRDGSLEVHRQKLERSVLENQIRRLHAGLRDESPSSPVLRWLSQHLIGPIGGRIDAAERLLFVPDGPLHDVPFTALVREGGGGEAQYLIEQKPIHVAASASVYLRMQRGRRDRPKDTGSRDQRLVLAAFGDPSKLNATDQSFLASFAPPPHSGREARAIRRLHADVGDAVAFTGVAASEVNFKLHAPRARIVHIATQCVVNPAHPFNSFLVFDQREPLVGDDENGLLQAWELFDGHVRLAADLVVLSASQSAAGAYRGGEGVISLARAFQVAGARTVVASLWNLADDSTAELMIRFHRYLRDGLSKDVALQRAQIDLIRGSIEVPVGESESKMENRDFSAPYHWAAFQLFGDWR